MRLVIILALFLLGKTMGDQDDHSGTVVTVAIGSLVVITVTTSSAMLAAFVVVLGFLTAFALAVLKS